MRRALLVFLVLLASLPLPFSTPRSLAAAAGTGIATDGLLFAYDAANYNSYKATNGSSLYDLSGNGRTATLTNTPTFNRSSSGSYFAFDGGVANTYNTSDYILGPALTSGTNFNSGTGNAVGAGFSLSFYGSFGVLNSFERIIDFGGGSTTNNIWFGRYGNTNDVKIETWNGASLIGSVTSNTAPITNGLQQWTVVMSNTGTNIYLNGTSIASTTSDIRPVAAARSKDYIGASNWGDEFFEGKMYRLAIYNKALTSSEITQNYNSMIDVSWPSLTSSTTFNTNENTSAVATLSADQAVSYYENTSVGNNSVLSITTAGAITFDSPPNYESVPSTNSLTYNVYVIDANGNYQEYTLTINVLDVAEFAALSVPNLSATPYKGINVTITVTPTTAANTPGKVTYLVNGKRIPGCLNKTFTGTGSSTCTWKPASMGFENLSVTFTPNKTAGGIQEYVAATSRLSPLVLKRTTLR